MDTHIIQILDVMMVSTKWSGSLRSGPRLKILKIIPSSQVGNDPMHNDPTSYSQTMASPVISQIFITPKLQSCYYLSDHSDLVIILITSK